MSLDLGELSAKITVDDKGFNQGLDRGQRQFGVFAKKIAVAAAAAGIAAGGALVVGATKQFAALQTGMNEVFTLLPGISESAMDKMTTQVKGFAKEFGVLPDEVVPALYQSLSAGVPPGNVFDFMATAQKAAKGGVTELETAVDGITGVVNAYGAEVIDATAASDIMFTTVRLGKTNFEGLSTSLGDVTPIASALGVSFEEVSAAMAASTVITGNTAKSATGLKTMLSELGKEGQVAAKNFEGIAGKSFPDFIAAGGTLQEALQMMEADTKKTGGSMIDMFGSVEAGQTALQLTGKGAKTFAADLDAMNESAGATDAAYKQMDQGLGASWGRIKAAAAVALVDMGDKLEPLTQGLADFALVALPMVVDGVGDLVGWLGQLGAAFSTVAGFVDDHQTSIIIIAGLITTLLLPAIIAWGVQHTISAAKAAAAWVLSQVGAAQSAAMHVVSLTMMSAAWIKTGVQATMSALRVAAAWLIAMGPIGLVIAAIAGLTFLIVKNWDKIKEVFFDGVDWVKDNWKKLGAILLSISGPIGAVVLAFIKNFDKIKGAASDIIGFVKGIPDKIRALGSKFGDAGRWLINAFVNGLKNAGGIISGIAGNVWNAVRTLLNQAINKINAALEFTIEIPGPNISINPPNIPQLANGGLVKAQRGGTLAVLAEAGEDEWAVPESKADAFARARLSGKGNQGSGYPTGDRGPLIQNLYQQPNESADDLAERIFRTTRARG